MSSCCLTTCKNTYRNSKNKNVSFFRFPQDGELLKKWLKACRRSDVNVNSAFVCSEHFLPEDIHGTLQQQLLGGNFKRSLKKGAIPSINLPSAIVKQTPEKGAISRDERHYKRDVRKRALRRLQELSPTAKEDKKPSNIIIISSSSSSNNNNKDNNHDDTNNGKTIHTATNSSSNKASPSKTGPIPMEEDPKGSDNVDCPVHSETSTELASTESGNDCNSSAPKAATNNGSSSPLKDHPELLRRVEELEKKFHDLYASHKITLEKNKAMERRLIHMAMQIQRLQRMKSPLSQITTSKKLRLKILSSLLEGRFTPAQIHCLATNQKQGRWQKEDISNATELKAISEKAYMYVKNKMGIPIPGRSTLQRWKKNSETPPPSEPPMNIVEVVELTDIERCNFLSFAEIVIDSSGTVTETS